MGIAVREATELFSESEVSHRLVDRAIGELRPVDVLAVSGADQDVHDCVRDELFGLLAHLHFNDISARELDYAVERIGEMRRWLDRLTMAGQDLPR